MVIYTVYQIRCTVNNKIYIGYTSKKVEERFKQHVACSTTPKTKFHRVIKKYTPSCFTIEELYHTHDGKLAGQIEDQMIMLYDSITTGYNTVRGGQGGCIALFKENPDYDRIRQKISESQKKRADIYRAKALEQHKHKNIGMYGKNHSQETKAAIGYAHKGKLISDDQKEKQMNSMRKTFDDPMYTHPNKGRVRTQEERAKMSANHSDMRGDNNPMFGKNHSQETLDKLKQKAKNRERVQCTHCKKIIDVSNHARWHGESCKERELDLV